jgi:(R,R)-butanediol dehydrogenase/meso-butanediol dehydrogenase/diacetyl reductase
MRGVLFRQGEFEVRELPEPPAPGPGQVVIDVLACGICETDVAVYQDTSQFLQGAIEGGIRTYDFDADDGIVMGHEFAGRVVEIGADVETLAVGDQVSGYATVIDNEGRASVAGYSNRYPGGFGERMLVQADVLTRNPPGLPPDVATLAEPLSIGEKAVQRSGIEPNDAAVVMGAGPIGVGAIAALRARGISPIIALESNSVRQRLAANVGANTVLFTDDPELQASLETKLGAARVIAFECSGEAGMIDRLIYALPRGAKIMAVGANVQDDVIRPWVAIYKSIIINFQNGDTTDAYPITLDRIASGTLDTEGMITGRVSLEGVADAFRELEDASEHVRIIVMPRGLVDRSAAGQT